MHQGITITCVITLIFASLGISFEISNANGQLDKENRDNKKILSNSIFSNRGLGITNNNAGTYYTALTLTESDISYTKISQQETKIYKSSGDDIKQRDTSGIINNNDGANDTALE